MTKIDTTVINKNPKRVKTTLTYMSGNNFCHNPMVMVYANSLVDHFKGTKVILTHEMDKEMRDIFTKMGFSIHDVENPGIVDIYRYRWKAFYEYFKTQIYFGIIAITDCKDVFWQSPIKVPDNFHNMMLCSEGIPHSKCNWNYYEQKSIQRLYPEPPTVWQDWEIVNGGVLYGTDKTLQEFAFEMYMITATNRAALTDQGFVNFLYHHRKNDTNCRFILSDPWKDSFAVTGNTIKDHAHSFQWRDGKLHSSGDVPFALFHQWDRTEWRSEILTKYGACRF